MGMSIFEAIAIMKREDAIREINKVFIPRVAKDIIESLSNYSEIPTGSTTKNDLGVDCISREQSLRELKESAEHHANDSREEALLRRDRDIIRALPSVTPQEPQTFKWCTDCKEYDQDEHCCHRWSKAIRDTVEEMKQEYIEREVLDKIRDQLKSNLRGVEIALEVLVENDPLRPKMEGAKCTLEDCLELIDKAESEDKE